MIPTNAQPDQRPDQWDGHVSVYESVFEPFSLSFANAAIRTLNITPGQSVLDVAAGSGGTALALAAMGCRVSAIDAAAAMVARIDQRAAAAGATLDARVMDGQALTYADNQFEAALSVFGVILFPDAERGLAEMRRVVRTGGRVAIVTWTEPQNYELATALRRAIVAVTPEQPPSPLPAQLRFRERETFAALFRSAGFDNAQIDVCTATLRAPSARWLADRLDFAPGMSAQLANLGANAPTILAQFIIDLERQHGPGEIALSGSAFIGTAMKT